MAVKKKEEGIDKFLVKSDIFRVPVYLYVWDIWEEKTIEYMNKELESMWVPKEKFDYNVWGHSISRIHWHIVWLAEYDLWILMHEMIHVSQLRLRFCWVDDDETQAYFAQQLVEDFLEQDKQKRFKLIVK